MFSIANMTEKYQEYFNKKKQRLREKCLVGTLLHTIKITIFKSIASKFVEVISMILQTLNMRVNVFKIASKWNFL